MKSLKKLLFILALLLVSRFHSCADVTLTDAEYNQIMEALNNSETQLTEQAIEIKNLSQQIESLTIILGIYQGLGITYSNLQTQSANITNQQAELLEPLKRSYETRENEINKSFWEGATIGGASMFFIGFIGGSLFWMAIVK